MKAKLVKDRCEHCGKFVRLYQLYTLYDKANEHPERESVAICEQCYDERSADYWERWLDKRFSIGFLFLP